MWRTDQSGRYTLIYKKEKKKKKNVHDKTTHEHQVLYRNFSFFFSFFFTPKDSLLDLSLFQRVPPSRHQSSVNTRIIYTPVLSLPHKTYIPQHSSTFFLSPLHFPHSRHSREPRESRNLTGSTRNGRHTAGSKWITKLPDSLFWLRVVSWERRKKKFFFSFSFSNRSRETRGVLQNDLSISIFVLEIKRIHVLNVCFSG